MQTTFVGHDGLAEGLREALLGARDSSEALHRLYLGLKAADRKFSMPYICRKAGIPSSGYLSDVFRGRRVLHPKYRNAIVKAFPLKGVAARYLKLLIALDNEADVRKRRTLRARLDVARKALHVRTESVQKDLHGMFFGLEVFCAFGLWRNRPTLADLVRYFGKDRAEDVERALALLKDMRLVTGTRDGYQLLSDQVVLNEDAQGLTHLDFLRLALGHAAANVDAWYGRRDVTHFEASILSVREEDFRRVIPELKQRFLLVRSELESGDADMLIRFNVQIYPTR